MDAIEAVGEAIDQSIRYARASERLLSAMSAAKPLSETLRNLLEAEPELGPEIESAVTSLQQIIDTLDAAGTFLTARFDDKQQRLRASLSAS